MTENHRSFSGFIPGDIVTHLGGKALYEIETTGVQNFLATIVNTISGKRITVNLQRCSMVTKREDRGLEE